MAKLRTISEAFQLLVSDDASTSMTICGLRRLVSQGAIPTVNIGQKKLVDYDKLTAYLNHPGINATTNHNG